MFHFGIVNVVGLVIALLISIWVYRDAEKNNMQPPIVWAIGTFLLCIIVLPLYLILKSQKNK